MPLLSTNKAGFVSLATFAFAMVVSIFSLARFATFVVVKTLALTFVFGSVDL
jgi:hypothetical protein